MKAICFHNVAILTPLKSFKPWYVRVFLRLNKFSLYGHICRTLGPETYFSGIMNSNLSRGLHEHNNNEFSFSQIYMGLEETIF